MTTRTIPQTRTLDDIARHYGKRLAWCHFTMRENGPRTTDHRNAVAEAWVIEYELMKFIAGDRHIVDGNEHNVPYNAELWDAFRAGRDEADAEIKRLGYI